MPQKNCHPSVVVLLSLLSHNSSAGGLMVFLAISVVSLIEADDDTNNSIGIGQEPPTP